MPRNTLNFSCCNNNTKTTREQLQSAKGLKSKYFSEPKIEKKVCQQEAKFDRNDFVQKKYR